MGNRNSSSSNSFGRSCKAACDHVVHTCCNWVSHVQTIGRTVYHACGGKSIKLWDVSRDGYYYNRRAKDMNDKLVKYDNHIGKISGKSYNWLNEPGRLVFNLNNHITMGRTIENIRRVACFLSSIFTKNSSWVPEIRRVGGSYIDGYKQNKNGMVYDMIASHSKELRGKFWEVHDIVKEDSYAITLDGALNNVDITRDNLPNEISRLSDNTDISTMIAVQKEHIESIDIYFQTEVYFLRGKNENGLDLNDSTRAWDYTAWFRKTGIYDKEASSFLHRFRTEHIGAFSNNVKNLKKDLENSILNMECLAKKCEIYSVGHSICGSIPKCNVDMLSNDDTLVIRSMVPSSSNQDQTEDGVPVASSLVERLTIAKTGDFTLQNYQVLINKLMESGLSSHGYRMRIIAPPPNQLAMAGAPNTNHPSQQDIIYLFATLGGYNGHEYQYNNELAILIESDNEFIVDGLQSTIRSHLGIEPSDMESRFNADNVGYRAAVVDDQNPSNNRDEVPAIGPHFLLLGPLENNNQKLQQHLISNKNLFFTTDVPNIFADIWHGLKFKVPVNNNQQNTNNSQQNTNSNSQQNTNSNSQQNTNNNTAQRAQASN